MLFYALTGLINAITSTFLGFFVYFKNRKSKINQLFALFCLSVAVWSYAYYFWPGAADKKIALLSFQLLHIGAIFIPIVYLHFILVWLNLYKEKKAILKLGYLASFILSCFVFTPLFIKDMVPKLSFKYWGEPGILYHFFLFIFLTYAFYAFYLLLKAYQKSLGTRRKQIKYILIGTAIGYIGGATNYFLWYNIPIPPVGNWSVTLYLIIVAYAIVKYHLMEIRVVLTQLLVGVIAILLLFQFLASETLFEYIWKGALLVAFLIFGWFLIKSVLLEIRSRERFQELTIKLKKAYKELERLDKAKSEFISIASHQLRTPLTAIKGYISMILEGVYGQMSKKIKKPMENVYKSNERLIKLINDLLSVSRIESGRMEMDFQMVLPSEIITSCVEELKIQAKNKKIGLKWEEPPKQEALPRISIDRDKMRQVILNIIDNAIKYTEGGEVRIKCQIVDDKYRIVISDTGAGMTKEEASYLFESFSRGKAGTELCAEGVGLGLYIAKKFVEMHGGKIWATSLGKGKGSTFYIELPIKIK